jgi:peroxiredoxin
MILNFVKLLIVVALFVSVLFASANASQTPQAGEPLPDFELTIPENPQARTYLGLKEGGSFKVPQIKADVVIIEIFSMYCPHCQREAPTLNEFYNRIQASDQLRDRVKIIGIGVGNSAYEVNFFREQYKIPFPMFEDNDFTVHKLLGEVRTPYFIGILIKPDGTHEIYYSKLGGEKDASLLLEEMIQLSGLKAP